MPYKSLELRVGFTIFVAALILIIGLMWFHGFKISRGSYEVRAVFPMVGGINPGDKVNVNGVEMGEVDKVILGERNVLLVLKLDAQARIPDDSHIALQAIGIMGERIVTILVGSSPTFLGPGAIMQGTYDSGVTEGLAALGSITEDLTALTKDMRKITSTLAEGEHFRRTVENLSAITDELRGILKENGGDMRAGTRSFRRAAERVDGILERNGAHIESTIASLDTVSRELPPLIRSLVAVTDSLGLVAESLRRDDNTAGALLRDRKLLDRLESAVQNLDELIRDIKANPKKYLKVEIF